MVHVFSADCTLGKAGQVDHLKGTDMLIVVPLLDEHSILRVVLDPLLHEGQRLGLVPFVGEG